MQHIGLPTNLLQTERIHILSLVIFGDRLVTTVEIELRVLHDNRHHGPAEEFTWKNANGIECVDLWSVRNRVLVGFRGNVTPSRHVN